MISSTIFAEGQLSNAKATLFTFTAAGVGVEINLCNTDTVDRIVKIYLKPGSTSRQLFAATLEADGGSASYTFKGLPIGAVIEGEAAAANVVDYSIWGGEVS